MDSKLSTFSSSRCPLFHFSLFQKAPVLTLVIGGNHEASNYFAELLYGGWLAPNIYFLGYAGVVRFRGLRIGGISGIYKSYDFFKGRSEFPPYSESAKKSTYHQRNVDVFRLRQMSSLDICMSHDWPCGVPASPSQPENDQFSVSANVERLLRVKQHFADEVHAGKLGSPPLTTLLTGLKPRFWFAGHLHVKFPAVVRHKDGAGSETRFLALDKPIPGRDYLHIVHVEDKEPEGAFSHDPEWLAILANTDHLGELSAKQQFMPGPGRGERHDFTPTDEEKVAVLEEFGPLEIDPAAFVPTAPRHNPADGTSSYRQAELFVNPQTVDFCERLGIPDWFQRVKAAGGKLSTPDERPELVGREGDSFVSSKDSSFVDGSPLDRPGGAAGKEDDSFLSANTSVVSTNPDEISLDDPGDFESPEDHDRTPPSTVTDVSPLTKDVSFPEIRSPEAPKRPEATPQGDSAIKRFKRRNASFYQDSEDS